MRFPGNTICLFLALILTSGCRTTHQTAANPKSNARAKAILRYVQSLERRTNKRVLSGQFSDFGKGASLRLMTEIHNRTGHWPAILGVDYADFATNGLSLTHDAPNQAVIGYWKQGGLVTISAHLYNPARTNASGGLRDKDVDLNALLDPSSETHVRWLNELDQLADGLQQLKDAGMVVLWRPFHEMNGNWFWWGGKDPATFIKLWRQMFDYFTKTKGLDNLLWVYSPGSDGKTAVYYPGDRYVDLVGLDAYTDFVDARHIKGYTKMARIKKPFGFAEFGPHAASNPPGDYDYPRFIQGVQKDFPRTTFFMCWNNKWSLASNTNTAELLNHPWIVNREDLPNGLAGSP
jgi:mannan endo-1,4-beta-mannosidase